MNCGLLKDANSLEENNQEPKYGQIREFMMTMKLVLRLLMMAVHLQIVCEPVTANNWVY